MQRLSKYFVAGKDIQTALKIEDTYTCLTTCWEFIERVCAQLNLNKYIKLIEIRRTEIAELYENSVLTDSNVLKKSWELDAVLNNYYKMLKKQTEQS